MTQASNKPVIWTVIICALLLLGGVYLMIPEAPVAPVIPAVPTAAAIAAEIVIPAPVDNSATVNKLCELTDGCEYWESQRPGYWVNKVMNEDSDIEEAILDVLNLDEDFVEIEDIEVRESQVRDYSTDYEGYDGNWDVQIFAKVTYLDEDEDDHDHAYVVISSVFDEGDYEDVSVAEVSRNFEF